MKSALTQNKWTLFVLATSVLVALMSNLGSNLTALKPLLITNIEIAGNQIYVLRDFWEAFNQQWWRLVTPAVIHFGIIHLVFNLLWWWELGNLLERHYGTFNFMLLFLVLAVSSNLSQFFSTGPLFGGLSGVVYGLLAYIFGRGFKDRSYFQLKKELVWFMLGWYVICWTGLIGNVANVAHSVGLALGLVIGLAVNGIVRLKKN